jgi:hypothetical protein
MPLAAEMPAPDRTVIRVSLVMLSRICSSSTRRLESITLTTLFIPGIAGCPFKPHNEGC